MRVDSARAEAFARRAGRAHGLERVERPLGTGAVTLHAFLEHARVEIDVGGVQAAIEQATGFNFLSKVRPQVRVRLKKRVDTQ
mgnify:CR=1 FL=1